MTTQLYPFRFQTILQRYIWGGRRLGTILGKPIGRESDYAESWEICDHGSDQSVVAHGPLQGETLHQLIHDYGKAIFGRHYPQPQFPLLLKYLDAAQTLSVQVHPDDARAAQLDPPDLGKTEAWIILDAADDSLIYSGLKPGVTPAELAAAIEQGNCQECLHSWHPQKGDCVFLQAGAVHALGGGVLVAEIQQASNTTYRLFDWNRVGPNGKARSLHIAQGVEAIDYDLGPVDPQPRQQTIDPDVACLVACDKFVLNCHTFAGVKNLAMDDRFHILSVLEGEVTVAGDPSDVPLKCGDSMLLPAAWEIAEIRAPEKAVLLEAYLP